MDATRFLPAHIPLERFLTAAGTRLPNNAGQFSRDEYLSLNDSLVATARNLSAKYRESHWADDSELSFNDVSRTLSAHAQGFQRQRLKSALLVSGAAAALVAGFLGAVGISVVMGQPGPALGAATAALVFTPALAFGGAELLGQAPSGAEIRRAERTAELAEGWLVTLTEGKQR